MPRKGFKKVNDPFSDLDSDWRDAVSNSSRDEIQHRIAKVALDDSDLRKDKKEDQHLAECANTYKEAGERYRNGFKENKLKIEFLKRVLNDKGGPTKSVEDTATVDAN